VSDYTDEQVKDIAAVAWAADAELDAQQSDPFPSLPGDAGDADAHGVTLARVRAILEGATPEELHEAWRRRKEAQGWKYGPRPDSREKAHPALVPYADLPGHQRVRDRVLAAIVREMAGQDAPEVAAAQGDRDDYAARLRATDQSWAKVAAERDQLREALQWLADDGNLEARDRLAAIERAGVTS
jgi:hypothetical protein